MGELKDAGIIDISRGKIGIRLAKELKDITLYDVYKAVGCVEDNGLFHFHENPNANCPVGRTIHKAMSKRLEDAQQALHASLKSTTLAEVMSDTMKEIQS